MRNVTAGAMSLAALWREAEQFGEVYLKSGPNLSGHHQITCSITRKLGKSELKTDFSRADTPERALFLAIEEARAWGVVATAPVSEALN